MEGITPAGPPEKLCFEEATENESVAASGSHRYYDEAGGGGQAGGVTAGQAAIGWVAGTTILGKIGQRRSWAGDGRSRGSQLKAVGWLARD